MPSPAVPSADPFQNILRDVLDPDSSQVSTSIVAVVAVLEDLLDRFRAAILACARDENVAGFKSVVCYRYGPLTSCLHAKTDTRRTGLDVALSAIDADIADAMSNLVAQYKKTNSLRLQQKVLSDYLVRIVLQIAGQYRKPGRFPQRPS